jgi:hypothetical protein
MRLREILESSEDERASIIAHTEEEYRLPNLANIVPIEHLHPVAKLGYLNVTIYRSVPEDVNEIRPGGSHIRIRGAT